MYDRVLLVHPLKPHNPFKVAPISNVMTQDAASRFSTSILTYDFRTTLLYSKKYEGGNSSSTTSKRSVFFATHKVMTYRQTCTKKL